ncbi:MAG TPA: MFS transporter [Chloroflexota bacterium]|nr:MFS transporter [Chloroflexota bacterium]
MSAQIASKTGIRLGLAANWRQFALLVVVNAFVGAMIGQERAVLPLIAEREFGLAAATAATSFIVSFGLTKAVLNLAAGHLADRLGRRRVLLIGWLVGLPVPVIIALAPDWWWIVAANVLLGVNQGLAWSMTLSMKVDLVGPERRGLALGLNESAGYLAVGLAAWGSSVLAATYGPRPIPFLIGLVAAILGLAISALLIRETMGHVRVESAGRAPRPFGEVFRLATWRDRRLAACSQAGLVNNANDALAWGILPLFFASRGMSLGQIGILVAVGPIVWGLSQLATGALSDRIGRKGLITTGLLVQAAAIAGIALGDGFSAWFWCGAAYGLGTGMVYPTLLAAVGDVAHASWRASALGVYRFWRDGGFVAGAVVAGVAADLAGVSAAVVLVATITALSALIFDRLYVTGRTDV